MIDTIKISTVDFEIDLEKLRKSEAKEGYSFGAKPSIQTAQEVQAGTKNQSLIFIDKYGTPCYGKSAHFNAPKYKVDIYNGRIVIQFSSPKIATGSNYYTSTKAEYEHSLKKVEQDLKEQGILTSLPSSNLSRLDLTTTEQMDHNFSTYMPVLNMLNGTRAKNKRQYHAQTMQWDNSQYQVCCYDKLAEIQSYEPGANISQYPQNSFRTELRLLNSKKIQTTLGISTAQEVYRNYDEIKGYRSQLLHDYVFKTEPKDFNDMLTGSIENMVKAYASTGKRNWFDYLTKDYGLFNLMKYTDTQELVNIYKAELEKKGMHTTESIRVQCIRMKKRIENKASTLMESLTVQNIPYRDLYLEIYKKFVA
jgi:hypothetical protein